MPDLRHQTYLAETPKRRSLTHALERGWIRRKQAEISVTGCEKIRTDLLDIGTFCAGGFCHALSIWGYCIKDDGFLVRFKKGRQQMRLNRTVYRKIKGIEIHAAFLLNILFINSIKTLSFKTNSAPK